MSKLKNFTSTAETTTPPLLNSSLSSESDLFICQTRTCIQPSHFFPATTQDGALSPEQNSTCYYGAKKCPSKVARAKTLEAGSTSYCRHGESEKEEIPSVEDDQLLKTEYKDCCKKKQELTSDEKGCKREVHAVVHKATPCCIKEENLEEERVEETERSPQITCCHNKKTSSESQEEIMK